MVGPDGFARCRASSGHRISTDEEFWMKNRTRIALGVAAAGIIGLGAVGGLAYADRGGHGGMGRWHHGMGLGMVNDLAERYDANKDGKITQDEVDANRKAWLEEFDADKNGTLSLDEFQALWLKARRERMVREFQEFDRDGNGQVTLDEYRQPMADIVATMDSNGDGALDRADRRERWRDHDGRRWHHRRGMMGDGPGMMDDDGTDGDEGENSAQ
jgi:Ca2+-binding EF-hand superfamily protein